MTYEAITRSLEDGLTDIYKYDSRATLDDEGQRNTDVANRDLFLHINFQCGVKRLIRQVVPCNVSGGFPGGTTGWTAG